MVDKKLLKGITACALDDWLRYKLGKSLIGIDDTEEEYEHFIGALTYLAHRPHIRRILSSLTTDEMARLLETLEDYIA